MARTIIVTGGSRGIGYGIATCFARCGDRLVIADLSPDRAAHAADELERAGAHGSFGLGCDVAVRAEVEHMVAQTVARAGRIDVLVNNAGICPFQDVMAMSEQTWRTTLDVNCTGAFLCTQAVAREMIAHGEGGRVVFITSLAENVTGPLQVDYGASKAGMRMTMVGFATALGRHGITCNAVAPGMILTDMTRHHWEQPGPAAEIKVRVPVGRLGTPEDIGHAVVFLASPEAAYINGVTLRVDGGHQAVCA
jgi:NAD(P)-dependent dehydrogenase (short-subunit alcohol dehydrogenase family)